VITCRLWLNFLLCGVPISFEGLVGTSFRRVWARGPLSTTRSGRAKPITRPNPPSAASASSSLKPGTAPSVTRSSP